MQIDILTLFPEAFSGLAGHSMWGRGQKAGAFSLRLHDIRDHTTDRHRRTDDYPFGGGAGLVMTAQPLVDAVQAVDPQGQARRVLLSPRGRLLTHALACEMAREERLVLVCGHYEGVDQRAVALCRMEELSIGDYVLTGGELAAAVVVDPVIRHIPGVLGSEASTQEESHANGLLEYPHYTRPAQFGGLDVPEVLLSGHHANIEAWRRREALRQTARTRPDLLAAQDISPAERAWLEAEGLL